MSSPELPEANNAGSESALCNLPPELRYQIYNYILALTFPPSPAHDVISIRPLSDSYKCGWRDPEHSLALIYLNRQISNEFTPLVFRMHTFFIGISRGKEKEHPWLPSISCLRGFFTSARPQNLAAIRSLEISLPYKRYWERSRVKDGRPLCGGMNQTKTYLTLGKNVDRLNLEYMSRFVTERLTGLEYLRIDMDTLGGPEPWQKARGVLSREDGKAAVKGMVEMVKTGGLWTVTTETETVIIMSRNLLQGQASMVPGIEVNASDGG
jgi:hypothetical protein